MRLAWGDTHGYSRAKTLTVPAFLSALTDGYNIGVATTTLDSAGARVFASFTRGGGMGLDEMTGSPNLTVVADPSTFRVLPWAPGVGWILCDEYFNDGRPFHFAPRQLLRKALQKLAERGYASVVGAEIEWYLLRVADDHLSDDNIGAPGTRGRPIRTWPAEPGYHYHSESNMDLMQPVFDALGDAFEALGLGLRSIENEWGPGQVECTFAPRAALEAADNVLLFRTATRQICRRLGYFATFMCRPGAQGLLRERLAPASVADRCGERRTICSCRKSAGEVLSPLGQSYLGGPAAIRGARHGLRHADRQRLSALPAELARARPRHLGATINRGAMIRVLGGPGDPATRLENRIGEPAANPYLYILSQIVAGLAGIEAELAAAAAGRRALCGRAAAAAEKPAARRSMRSTRSRCSARALGDTFVDYFVKLKRTEAGRYQRSLEDSREPQRKRRAERLGAE